MTIQVANPNPNALPMASFKEQLYQNTVAKARVLPKAWKIKDIKDEIYKFVLDDKLQNPMSKKNVCNQAKGEIGSKPFPNPKHKEDKNIAIVP